MSIIKKLAKEIILGLLLWIILLTAILNNIELFVFPIIIGLLFLYLKRLSRMKNNIRKKLLLYRISEVFIVVVIAYYMVFTSPINTLFYTYSYESTDHGFKDLETRFKGNTLEDVEAAFNKYKQESNSSDVELRRTFKQNWLETRRWYDYFTNRRWKYKYMPPQEAN